MKLILKAVGYENFSGLFGAVEFIDGTSVDDVNPHIAKRLACIITVEWDDGTTVGVADRLLENAHTPAPNETATVVIEPSEIVAPTTIAWTEEELGQLADEKGIAGLREIAEPAGVKGNSIAGLIKAIVEKSVPKEVK